MCVPEVLCYCVSRLVKCLDGFEWSAAPFSSLQTSGHSMDMKDKPIDEALRTFQKLLLMPVSKVIVCTCMCIYVCTHVYTWCVYVYSVCARVCMYVYMCVYTCVYMVCICVQCMCTCVYVCVYVCVHV